MLSRFECPRCQTVFTHEEGDDDAFVECPSCGALAMSAGDATGVDSDALARALSSTHDVASLQASLSDQTQEGTSGLESTGLGDESGSGNPFPNDDDDDNPLNPDGPTPMGGIFSGLLGANGEVSGEDDDPENEQENEHNDDDDDDDESLQAPPKTARGHAAQDESTSPLGDTRDGSDAGELDLGLDDELGDFELPSTAPGNRALSPTPKRPQPRPSPRIADPAGTNVSDMGDALDEVRSSLGDDALDALGAAFDTMAQAPDVQRRGDGLSDADRAFLEAQAPQASLRPARPAVRQPPPRPPERPGEKRAAPPPRRKRSAKPAGLSLSAEARDAAFLPLKAPAESVRPAATPATQRRDADTHDATDVERARPEPRRSRATGVEPTEQLQRPKTKASRPVRERPTVMGGLHKGLLAAAVLVGLVGGGVAGAVSAPAAVKRQDPRARAEAALADGNRYYQDGRFDDALGKYRAATNIDRTFALAHRAKGSAFAKQKSFDEAADAYREYLTLEPTAIDADDIKAALARRGLKPVETAPPPGEKPAANEGDKDAIKDGAAASGGTDGNP